MFCFILVQAERDERKGQKVVVRGGDNANNIDEFIDIRLSTACGSGLPDHCQNVADELPVGTSPEVVKAEAIRRTKARFGIGEPAGNYGDSYVIIQVDLATGDVVTYPE